MLFPTGPIRPLPFLPGRDLISVLMSTEIDEDRELWRKALPPVLDTCAYTSETTPKEEHNQ
jgi:hypothetical protein